MSFAFQGSCLSVCGKRRHSLPHKKSKIGFIRFEQLTLPKAVSIPDPGVPDNARAVHTEMIGLFLLFLFICERLFASGFNCESG